MKPEIARLYKITSKEYNLTDVLGLYIGISAMQPNGTTVYKFMIGLDCDYWLYESEILEEIKYKNL